MNGSTKANSHPSTETTLAELEAETQDEIEQIMSEIEELQQEMGGQDQLREPQVTVPPATAKISSRQPLSTTAPTEEPAVGLEDRSLSEFVTVEEDLAEAPKADESDVSPVSDEPWVEETLAHLAGGPETAIQDPDPTEKSILDQADSEQLYEALQHGIQNLAKVQPPEKPIPAAEISTEGVDAKTENGSVTLNMKGATNFNLKYEIDGREVVIALGADGIRLQLSDGTELVIPVRNKSLGKKAA